MALNHPSILQQFSQGLGTVGAQVLPSLVQIMGHQRGMGAGTIVDASGIVVTNAHVVANVPNRSLGAAQPLVEVRLMDGRTSTATVIAFDEQQDLAALQIDLPHLMPLSFATDQLLPGTLVMAFGFPFGVRGGATSGVVIELKRAGTAAWLAASLHLRPGHSGGPMVNALGQLVGINAMMTGPDVGVAVPVSAVMHFLQQLTSTAPLPAITLL